MLRAIITGVRRLFLNAGQRGEIAYTFKLTTDTHPPVRSGPPTTPYELFNNRDNIEFPGLRQFDPQYGAEPIASHKLAMAILEQLRNWVKLFAGRLILREMPEGLAPGQPGIEFAHCQKISENGAGHAAPVTDYDGFIYRTRICLSHTVTASDKHDKQIIAHEIGHAFGFNLDALAKRTDVGSKSLLQYLRGYEDGLFCSVMTYEDEIITKTHTPLIRPFFFISFIFYLI
jgi:hypothetical protein